jgi:hypothetical protein
VKGGWGKTKKKMYSQQKSKKKKIFPGIVPEKNSFPGRYRAAKSHGLPKKEKRPRDVLFK